MLEASVRPDPKAPFARAEITVRGLPTQPNRPGFQLRRSNVDYLEPNLDIGGWTRSDIILLPLESWWSDADGSFHLLISGLLYQHIDPGPLKFRLPDARIEVDLFWPDDIAVYDDGTLSPPTREPSPPADADADAARRVAESAAARAAAEAGRRAEAARAEAQRQSTLNAERQAEEARAEAVRQAEIKAEREAEQSRTEAARQARDQAEKEAQEASAAQSPPLRPKPRRRLVGYAAFLIGIVSVGAVAMLRGGSDDWGLPLAEQLRLHATDMPIGQDNLTRHVPPADATPELRTTLARVVPRAPSGTRDRDFDPFLMLRPAAEIIGQTSKPESLLRYGEAKLEQKPPNPADAETLFYAATQPNFGPKHTDFYPPAFVARGLLYDPSVTQDVSLPFRPQPAFAESLYQSAIEAANRSADTATAALARAQLQRLQHWRAEHATR